MELKRFVDNNVNVNIPVNIQGGGGVMSCERLILTKDLMKTVHISLEIKMNTRACVRIRIEYKFRYIFTCNILNAKR